MSSTPETVEDPREGGSAEAVLPGIVLLTEAGRPVLRAALTQGAALVLGRGDAPFPLEDDRASRRHAELHFHEGRWRVRDLGSRNGTFLQGRRLEGPEEAPSGSLVRVGWSLALLCADVRPYLGARVAQDERGVRGPVLERALRRVEQAARAGRGALLLGESGAGKELAARCFHAATERPSGPFVAVNCAAIPEGVAERLLFGARKGAYSGATADSAGYLESAHGGTLFLDEVGELELAVQAKLLRVLETQEVLRLGDTHPRRVDVRLCSATHRNLRSAAGEGRFRADLYYRIAQPEVALPPLRERFEELPVLVQRALAEVDPRLSPEPRFLEACLLRPWPGNVRELLGAVREAGHQALERDQTLLTEESLPPSAGVALGPEPPSPASAASAAPPAPRRKPGAFTRAELEEALAAEGHNVAAAARRLGLHRTQLYRLLERFDLQRREG